MTLIGRWLEEKERVEKLAQTTERLLASITSASADAILSLELDGTIESWNRGAELLFGYAVNDVRGRPLTVLLGGGEASEVEFHWLLENVRQLNASLNEQVAERTRELAEKVEELARANAELQKLDQMRSEFVSLVSHQGLNGLRIGPIRPDRKKNYRAMRAVPAISASAASSTIPRTSPFCIVERIDNPLTIPDHAAWPGIPLA